MGLPIAMALLMVATYLICGIPFGLLIARAMGGGDVRSKGSGNIGTTNVARTVGAKAAGLTLLADVLKGVVCVVVARAVLAAVFFDGDASVVAADGEKGWLCALVYLCCILGHVFSPYLGFHGGKGIAAGFGGALGFCWPLALGLLLVFVLLVVPTRYVSLGSCCAAASLPVWGLVMGVRAPGVAVLLAIAVVVIWAHRANLARLAHGEERRFSFHKE